MTEKKINLEELLKAEGVSVEFLEKLLTPDGIKNNHKDRILNAMHKACEQILELATENVKLEIKMDYPFMPTLNGDFEPKKITVVDKKSITDTINQVI